MPSIHQDNDKQATAPTYYGVGYGYGALAGADELGDGFSLTDIIGVLRRRWEIVSFSLVLGTIAAILLGYMQPVTYTAGAKLLIEPEHRVVDLDSVVEGVSADAATIETQLNLLKSSGFLESFVKENYAADLAEARALRELERMKNFVDTSRGEFNAAFAKETSPVETSSFLTMDIDSKIAEIASNLRVVQEGRSFIIDIAYTSRDPQEAATTANALAEHYIDSLTKRRRDITGNASAFLEDRLKDLEAELIVAEEAAQRYRAENPTSAKGDVNLTDERLTDLISILLTARADRKEKEARLNYIQDLQRQGGNLASLTEVRSSRYMASLWDDEARLRTQEAELRRELGTNHPRIVALNEERSELEVRIKTEIDKIISNLKNELKVLFERERSLEQDMEELSVAAHQTDASNDRAAIRLRLLEGKAETNRRIYEEFLLRLKQTREQEAIVQANTRLVASAKVPTMPSSSGLLRYALIGFVGSSAVGFGLAYLRDQTDRKLRNSNEIKKMLGIPCLGLIPLLSKKMRDDKTFDEYLVDKPSSRFAEALRSFYTQMIISQGQEDAPKVLQITSSIPDEGKTTFATSLATMLALDGKPTLLIDLDLRNPSIHRTIDLTEIRSFGPYLRGKSELNEESMMAKLETGCHVLATMSPAKDPGKLMRSKKLADLIKAKREQYDFIIIDGPPSLGLSDSKALLPLVDALILIVRWNSTNADQILQTIDELKQCNAKITGAVLNQVDLKKQQRYGYDGSSYYKNTTYYRD